MGSRFQHRHQPVSGGDPEARLLQVRDPHRRPAGPLAALSRGDPDRERDVTQWLINLVGSWGLIAIFVTMTAESAGLPISSEIVVPLGGALAAQGKLSLAAVVAVSSVANLVGS